MISLLTKRNGKAERVEVILSRAEKAADQVNRLQELSRQLQAENRKLRKLTHMSEHVRMVRKAHEAAIKLAAMHLAGYRTGRKSAYAVGGIRERTYFLARALLELAALHADGQFVTDDPGIIENNLQAAVKAAEADFNLLNRQETRS
jgi:hypothetical protein